MAPRLASALDKTLFPAMWSHAAEKFRVTFESLLERGVYSSERSAQDTDLSTPHSHFSAADSLNGLIDAMPEVLFGLRKVYQSSLSGQRPPLHDFEYRVLNALARSCALPPGVLRLTVWTVNEDGPVYAKESRLGWREEPAEEEALRAMELRRVVQRGEPVFKLLCEAGNPVQSDHEHFGSRLLFPFESGRRSELLEACSRKPHTFGEVTCDLVRMMVTILRMADLESARS